jgi:hypothetical protein
VLKSRSERSHLAPESRSAGWRVFDPPARRRRVQDAIDRVLFRSYGLSDEDGRTISLRLKEML